MSTSKKKRPQKCAQNFLISRTKVRNFLTLLENNRKTISFVMKCAHICFVFKPLLKFIFICFSVFNKKNLKRFSFLRKCLQAPFAALGRFLQVWTCQKLVAARTSGTVGQELGWDQYPETQTLCWSLYSWTESPSIVGACGYPQASMPAKCLQEGG